MLPNGAFYAPGVLSYTECLSPTDTWEFTVSKIRGLTEDFCDSQNKQNDYSNLIIAWLTRNKLAIISHIRR